MAQTTAVDSKNIKLLQQLQSTCVIKKDHDLVVEQCKMLSNSNDALSEIQFKCLKLQAKVDNQSQMIDLLRKENQQNRDSKVQKEQEMAKEQ